MLKLISTPAEELGWTVVGGGAQITPRPVTGATSPSRVYLHRLRGAQGHSGRQELVYPSDSNWGDWDLGAATEQTKYLSLVAGEESTFYICICVYMCVCVHI